MRAVRYHARQDLRLDDVPEPTVDGDLVKIAVEVVGICGSDIHEYRGGPISIPTEAEHPLTGQEAPLTMGHEFAGTIVEVGPDAAAFQVGQRVAVNAAIWCEECEQCREGNTNTCHSIGFYGVSGDGAFADFVTVRARNVHELPADMATETGALLEPLATGVHAVRHAGVTEGDHVLVLGGGPIGLSITIAAIGAGASSVVVSEPSQRRRNAALAAGATAVIDPIVTDVVELVKQNTDGRGADIVFDAAAGRGTFDTALASVRRRGTVVNVAAWETPIEFNPTGLLFTEAYVTGSLAYTTADFERAIEIARSSGPQLQAMVTSRTDLDHLVEGFAGIAADPGADIKVIVQI